MLLCMVVVTALGQDRDSLMMKKYRYDVGQLRIRNVGLAFSGIMNTSIQADTVFIYNAWDSTMTFDFRELPEYISCEVIPSPLEPKQEGKMVVTYNAPLKGEYGRLVGYFFFYTNESKDNKKRIILSPDIKEDFSSLTEEEIENAPIMEFSETLFDFLTKSLGFETNVYQWNECIHDQNCKRYTFRICSPNPDQHCNQSTPKSKDQHSFCRHG